MSYEAWRREVANGTMADWDDARGCYVSPDGRYTLPLGYAREDGRGCCVQRMVNDPPTTPHQHCDICGHGLPWYDPADPERGYFDCDDDTPEEAA